MTAKVVLEQLGILKESVQPRRTNLKDTLQPVYEVDQPVGNLFLNEQEAVFGVNFRENPVDTNGVQDGPRITLSPLQFYSNFKPESLVPFDLSYEVPILAQATDPLVFDAYTVPSRKILLLSNLTVNAKYVPDPTRTFYQSFITPDAFTFTSFYYNVLSTSGVQYDATVKNPFAPTVSGFKKINVNVLQSGSINRTLVFGESSKVRLELKTPGNTGVATSTFVPAGAFAGIFITLELQGFLITKSEYETYQNISKRPTALDFGPKQKEMEPPQFMERPASSKKWRQAVRVKRFK